MRTVVELKMMKEDIVATVEMWVMVKVKMMMEMKMMEVKMMAQMSVMFEVEMMVEVNTVAKDVKLLPHLHMKVDMLKMVGDELVVLGEYPRTPQ